MPSDLPERVAVHGTRLDRLEEDLRELKVAVASGNKDIREIRDIILQAKGGWKTIVTVGGISGAVGALLAKVLPFIPLK